MIDLAGLSFPPNGDLQRTPYCSAPRTRPPLLVWILILFSHHKIVTISTARCTGKVTALLLLQIVGVMKRNEALGQRGWHCHNYRAPRARNCVETTDCLVRR